ncbi:MAG: putative Zn-dependent protease [Sulfitobacter sp.]
MIQVRPSETRSAPLKSFLFLLILMGCGYGPLAFSADTNSSNLPSLGDHTSGIISLEQEYDLGQSFLRSLRSQAPLLSDPVMQEYVELLIYRLASFSTLEDRRLTLAIINNESINAFAVPGGVVGINLGLFLHGETESETSAILAHEIAHLSQRHFARRTEASRKASIASMAGLLAGIVLIATAGTDAGLAAISASQGLSQSELLRYSRSREKEADLVGIDTLAAAGLDPNAMAYMFERLSRSQRFSGRNVPEFLLTHPVTKDRISDSIAKSSKLPTPELAESLDYQLMRARAQVIVSDNAPQTVAQMKSKLNDPNPIRKTAAIYGLALAQMEAGQFDDSMQNILQLQYNHPRKLAFVLAEAELHLAANRFEDARDLIAEALIITPRNYPLTMAYADALMKSGDPELAAEKLVIMSQERPNDHFVWYILAEAQGLANNIVGVHEARAEYFVRVGNLDQAIKQLGFATPLVRNNFQQSAKIKQRIQEIFALKASRS